MCVCVCVVVVVAAGVSAGKAFNVRNADDKSDQLCDEEAERHHAQDAPKRQRLAEHALAGKKTRQNEQNLGVGNELHSVDSLAALDVRRTHIRGESCLQARKRSFANWPPPLRS